CYNNMEKVCRVCRTGGRSLVKLFAKRAHKSYPNEPRVSDMLRDCVDWNARADDPFPKLVCKACVQSIRNAFHLKQKYEQSHQYFCELLQKQEDPKVATTTMAEGEDANAYGFKIKMDAVESEEQQEDSCQESQESPQPQPEPEPEPETPKSPLPRMGLNADGALNETKDAPADSQSKLFICDSCGDGFVAKNKLILHQLNHNVNNECPFCQKLFGDRSGLTRHIRIHISERNHACPHCSKAFTEKVFLKRHIQLMHEKRQWKYKCPHCQKSFSRKSNFLYHVNIHFGDRPFLCNACSCMFETDELLELHKGIHQGRKPWQDELEIEMDRAITGSESANTINLADEANALDLGESSASDCGPSPSQTLNSCDICGRKFASRMKLILHLLEHVNRDNNKCPYCEKVFRDRTGLKRHILVHSGEKTFHCPYCSRSFFYKTYLKTHMRLHTNERPYT
ncbi:hypothetical protein KR222_003714, partial [Zaprionus bogoriensis]